MLPVVDEVPAELVDAVVVSSAPLPVELSGVSVIVVDPVLVVPAGSAGVESSPQAGSTRSDEANTST